MGNKKNKTTIIALFILISVGFFAIQSVKAIKINEIMYSPKIYYRYNEWVEIYNDQNKSINVSGWKLCNDKLLAGYIDNRDGQKLKMNKSTVINPGEYAIITDGEQGTEAYSNYNISPDSISLHVKDKSSLCKNGLKDKGEQIIIKNKTGSIVENISYSPNQGAKGNGKSLQYCSGNLIESKPTPGSKNNCKTENQTSNENMQTNQKNITNQENKTSLNLTQTKNTSEKNLSLKKVDPSPDNKTHKKNPKQPSTITLNTTPNSKDIKTKKNLDKPDKEKYAKYGLVLLAILVIMLILLKDKIFKKQTNEFQE